MSALVERLRSHGERVAVLTDTAQLTYRELADRIDEAAHALGDARRLVLLETRNDISTLVHYLGALAARHVVLPVPAGRDQAALDEIYAPDVVIDDRGVHHRHHDARPLHDDLSLLMSTSGSTGSPKLVRLSHANLIANATVIAEYLGIRETDRAATTLPMSYCYGLSVIHSHLLVGAEPDPDRPFRGRRTVLEAVPSPQRDRRSRVCRTPSNCSSVSASTPPTCPTCGTSRRQAAECRPSASAVSPNWRNAVTSTCS